uniref:Uncharacterized protein n=1 Tax=Oryza barthii TaxID=65489 RepID=A0A0D3HCL0_9ORYZ
MRRGGGGGSGVLEPACFTLQATKGKLSNEKSESASEYATRRRDSGRSSGRGKSSPQRRTQSDEPMRVSATADEAAAHSAVASSGVLDRQDRAGERGDRRCHGSEDGSMDEVSRCLQQRERAAMVAYLDFGSHLAHDVSGIWWWQNAGGQRLEAWN